MHTRKLRPIIVIAGTRPEAIKMMSVYQALKQQKMPVLFCATSQHKQMLAQMLDLFDIIPDIDLNLMKSEQDLFYITQAVLLACKELFNRIKPSYVLVQGDTTSAMGAALAAFYLHIPVGHVEAGLRTKSIYEPFPEEFNRRMISMVTRMHFTPTCLASANLLKEGISRDAIFQTGNTVVDALYWMRDKINQQKIPINQEIKNSVQIAQNTKKKIMLMTVHRRESIEQGSIKDILSAMKTLAKIFHELIIFYPIHPNPDIQKYVIELKLDAIPNIIVTKPLAYQDLVYVLLNCNMVATDSGGISEEAISFGKKVFILREETERIEGIWAGIAELVSTRYSIIVKKIGTFLQMPSVNSEYTTVFGDGSAGKQIAQLLKQHLEIFSIHKQIPKISCKKGKL